MKGYQKQNKQKTKTKKKEKKKKKEERKKERKSWLKSCFTSTETVGLWGTGAQDVHLDFHTAAEL